MPRKHKLKYRREAQAAIVEIARVHSKLVGALSAKRIVRRIRGAIDNLRTNPYMGMACRSKRLAALGYRYLICGNYLCFYRLIDEVIHIYHILDGRTDYEKQLASLDN